MTAAFHYRTAADGRRVVVTHGGREVSRFDFALPDAPRGPVTAGVDYRVEHDDLDGDWRTLITVDNLDAESRALLPVGVGITVAPGWAGWTWASDLEGIVWVAPLKESAPTLLVRLSGFVRVASTVPVFAPVDRRPDPQLPGAYAALHLANPTGSLRGAARSRTTLSFAAIDSPRLAGQFLPGWLPDLVCEGDDEIVFNTPDQAVVGGPGVTIDIAGNAALVTALPGHGEIAFHDVRGVRRLRASFAPVLRHSWLGDLATDLMRVRPSAATSAAAAVVVQVLTQGAAADRDQTLDWLERVDWLDRGDLLAVSVAQRLAAWNRDPQLASDAWVAACALPPGPGRGFLLSDCGFTILSAGGKVPNPELATGRHRGADPWSQLEDAVITRAEPTEDLVRTVEAAQTRLGVGLPGEPIKLTEAEAGYLIHLLLALPWTWDRPEFQDRVSEAGQVAHRAGRLLLADHAAGLQPGYTGLAWLLMQHEDAG